MWFEVISVGGLALISKFLTNAKSAKPDWMQEYEDAEQLAAISKNPEIKQYYQDEMKRILDEHE